MGGVGHKTSRCRFRRAGFAALAWQYPGGALAVLLSLATLNFFAGCHSQANQSTLNSNCLTAFDPAADYFPDKIHPTHAQRFTISYHQFYKVVSVADDQSDTLRPTFVLIRCGAPDPPVNADLAAAIKLRVPLTSVALSTTNQLGALELLNSLEAVQMIKDSRELYSEKARQLTSRPTVTGSDGSWNVAAIAHAQPQLVFADHDTSLVTALAEQKIPAAVDQNGWESSPLGRAEWLKFYSVFLNREREAEAIWSTIHGAYTATKDELAAITHDQPKPMVFAGVETAGVWRVPASKSWISTLIRDAGGDPTPGELPGHDLVVLETDQALQAGCHATIWLNGNWTGPVWQSAADAKNPEYLKFPPMINQAVWNPVARINQTANDFWQSGQVRPDLVLQDVAAILYPERFVGREPYYYKKLG